MDGRLSITDFFNRFFATKFRTEAAKSSLCRAIEQGNLPMVKHLLEGGATISSALLYTIAGADDADRLIPFLLENGADPTAKDSQGRNALHYLVRAEKDYPIAAKALLEKEASFFDCEKYGHQTPLDLAVITEKEELVRVFCDHCADVNAKTKEGEGLFPLYQAATVDRPKIVKVLLELGANIDETINRRRTALHQACQSSADENVRLLVTSGAQLNIVDEDGCTPFSLIMDKNLNRSVTSIIKGLAKLKEDQPMLVLKDKRIIQEHPHLLDYFGECSEELLRMKKTKLFGPLTIYSILSKSLHHLSVWTKNPVIIVAFKQINCKEILFTPIQISYLRRRTQR